MVLAWLEDINNTVSARPIDSMSRDFVFILLSVLCESPISPATKPCTALGDIDTKLESNALTSHSRVAKPLPLLYK
jgi:hypothetical protein